MFILVNFNNIIKYISISKDYETNGNILINDGDGIIAIPQKFIKEVFEVEEVPENVETEKYCYTEEKGFYKNENYVEPKPEITNEELMKQIKTLTKENESLNEQITEIQLAMIEKDMEV